MNTPAKHLQIAIIGYGKMGKMVEKAAVARGHKICAIVDPKEGNQTNITAQGLKNADVCIEFSTPQAAIDNIRAIAPLHKNIIVGTTGWYTQLDLVKQLVESFKIGLLYAPNFAIGMNIFFKIIAEAATMFNPFENYDICCLDFHHNQKKDSPSGAGRIIGDIITRKIPRKKRILTESPDREILPEELQVLSLRCGSHPGTHEVIFDSPSDTVTLTHVSRNREGFALGAVQAAEWIQGRKGIFTMDDLIT